MHDRHSRQIVMSEFGEAGQARLRHAKVLVVGSGGLGAPALLYLAAAGVGVLGIADNDEVSLSNLNRQILYKTEDLGRSKALTAVQRLCDLNPEIKTIPYEMRVLSDNGPALVRQFDLVVEATDSLATKDLMNELCVKAGLPLVWGAVERIDGQIGAYVPGHTCRRCIFPTTPAPGTFPSSAEVGVIGAAAGVIGSLQAVEAVKILLGIGEPLLDRLLLWDGFAQSFDLVEMDKNPDCSVCGKKSG